MQEFVDKEFDLADALQRYANLRQMADSLYAESRTLAAEIESYVRSAGITRYKWSGYMVRAKQEVKVSNPEVAVKLYPQLVRTKVEPDVRAIKSAIETGGDDVKAKLTEVFDFIDRHEIVKDYTKGGQVEL